MRQDDIVNHQNQENESSIFRKDSPSKMSASKESEGNSGRISNTNKT